VVTLVESTFEGPDGALFTREIVRHPGAVAAVPLHADGTVTMVRQFRAPHDGFILELPAGKLDVTGEDHEAALQRELGEEVGLAASSLELLVSVALSPGFCDEVIHIYLATGLSEVPADAHGIEEEHMEIVQVPLAAVPDLIATGALVDGKSIIGLLATLRRQGS
jgi:ADP-ribose pyrophosphatase